jgi:beta-carotene hydroxylase
MSAHKDELEFRANHSAQAVMGEFAWPTLILGAVVLTGYAVTLTLADARDPALWLAFICATLLVYASYTLVHEAVHGSINGRHKSFKWLNNLLGYLGAQIIGAPFTAHRKEHLAHHRGTNKPGEDPDLLLAGGNLVTVMIGVFKALPLQLRFYLEHHWRDAAPQERAILVAEYVVMILWRAVYIALVGWKTGLLILVGATLLGVFITLVSFAWIVHRPFAAVGRYADTSTFVFPPLVDPFISWLWLFQNYHSVHHLFPRVPFYRYRHLFGQIEDVMIARAAPIVRIGEGNNRGQSQPTSKSTTIVEG